MLEKALYKVPHDEGWFHSEGKHSELGSDSEDVDETMKTSDQLEYGINGNRNDEDDNYKAV